MLFTPYRTSDAWIVTFPVSKELLRRKIHPQGMDAKPVHSLRTMRPSRNVSLLDVMTQFKICRKRFPATVDREQSPDKSAQVIFC